MYQLTSEVLLIGQRDQSIQFTLSEPWAYWGYLQETRWGMTTARLTQKIHYKTSMAELMINNSQTQHPRDSSQLNLEAHIYSIRPKIRCSYGRSYVVKWVIWENYSLVSLMTSSLRPFPYRRKSWYTWTFEDSRNCSQLPWFQDSRGHIMPREQKKMFQHNRFAWFLTQSITITE